MIIKPVLNSPVPRNKSTPLAREIWRNIEQTASRSPDRINTNHPERIMSEAVTADQAKQLHKLCDRYMAWDCELSTRDLPAFNTELRVILGASTLTTPVDLPETWVECLLTAAAILEGCADRFERAHPLQMAANTAAQRLDDIVDAQACRNVAATLRAELAKLTTTMNEGS